MSPRKAEELPTADRRHPRFFMEYASYERMAGGPDPQIDVVRWLSLSESWEERVWRSGVYCAAHCLPTAEFIWQNWSWRDVHARPGQLEPWLAANWGGIQTRIERRSVRRPHDMARYLLDYSTWAHSLRRRSWYSGDEPAAQAYAYALSDVQRVFSVGRYIALKLLRLLEVTAEAPIAPEGIYPTGAWSPRTCLVLLFPNYAPQLLGDDRFEHLALANRLAGKVKDAAQAHGLTLDWYEMQVLLCQYKASYMTTKMYPGASHDEEIAFIDKALLAWPGYETDLWDARRELFPQLHLGERRSWRHVRKPLGDCLSAHGYTWSDMKYDFERTTDLGEPVPWHR